MEVVEASQDVTASPGRLVKVERIAACLRAAEPAEVGIAVAFLSGELRQRQIGVSWATLRDAPAPAAAPALTLSEVDETFARVGGQAGPGSQGERRRLLADLFARATEVEQRFLQRLLGGELHQGALAGVMADAVARAAGVPAAEVRRALMLRGALGPVAQAALTGGTPALRAFSLEVGRPVQPMLAQPADSVETAMARVRPAAVEQKLDGARIQVHRSGGDVAVFTRTLDDITVRVPEIVEAALALPLRSAVLDGEAIALRPDGRPHPFQITASRVVSTRAVAGLRDSLPLTPFLFDVLHLDGEDLLARGGAERQAALEGVAPAGLLVPRVVTDDIAVAAEAFADAIARGHEGVVVKSLVAPYEAGRRGGGWRKVKPRHTLDLVVLAAEWGHGRRRGWLSNISLGARDPETGGFVMLGKTFKGMTDELLAWQTERFGQLAAEANDWSVTLRPEQVVEIAFDGVQHSSRYPGGVALRFARVLRYRSDKRPEDADTLATVRALYDASST